MAEEKENVKEEKDELEVLKETLAEKQNKIDELDDRFKRVMAEFENFKKRSSKEREGLYNSLIADIVSSILPAMDNLETAVSTTTEDTAYQEGVKLVYTQFNDVLNKFGVQKIETVGKTFDPELHEAVASVTDESLGEKEIKEEFRAGYKIGSKVIRHSMVSVAN